MAAAAFIYAIYALFTRCSVRIAMILNDSLRVYAIYAPRTHTYARATTRHKSISHARIYT